MTLEQSIITAALLLSAVLGYLYSVFLEGIYELYTRSGRIWVTVVVGECFVISTLAILEMYFNIAPHWRLVGVFNAAWGLPIIYWQEWQLREKRRQEHALEQG